MGEQLSTLDFTFTALAHPTRRGLLDVLVREPARVTDLAAQFACSLNVVSKHILILERAGLVRREQKGREHWLRLDAAPLSAAAEFVQRYRRLWENQLDRLGTWLDTMAEQEGAAAGPRRNSGKPL